MLEVISNFMPILNGVVIAVIGILYLAVVKNLNASLKAKNEQLSFWKDKAKDLEKKTPEYIEEVLAKRIKHREEEIKRLDTDNFENLKLLRGKTKALESLKQQLQTTTTLNRALKYYDFDAKEEIIIPDSELEIEVLGEIAVDSASILITDPLYIRDEWQNDIEFEDIRLYKHVKNGKVYQYGIDFKNYSEILEGFEKDVNELISDKTLIHIEIEREYSYSLAGAAYASISKDGYGELEFKKGHKGAGICVSTVYGDGYYNVYGEKYKGKLVRIFIDLQ
ncbi:MAG TPA: hypothetical protein ENK39_01945 [Epsilonproteobacteria bacterium]|nr:hypothetical protein [Campylobacterota bacterium]